jgi:hypothetical protein
MPERRVFGIGFQKTGTTALGRIFDDLGYRTASYHQFRHLAGREDLAWDEVEALALEIMPRFDAAKDTPWPLLYRTLDEAFPGSKFIHVTRDPEAWIGSAVKDFGTTPNAIHRLIYGSPFPKGNEAAWLERHARHDREVAEYFADRPDDLLTLRLEDGVTYEKVCGFLGEPLVGHGAPVANTRRRKKLKMLWWRMRRHL